MKFSEQGGAGAPGSHMPATVVCLAQLVVHVGIALTVSTVDMRHDQAAHI